MNKDNDFIPVLVQIGRCGVMVLDANLNNITVITLLSVLLLGGPEKLIDLSRVALSHEVVSSILRY